MRIRSNELSLVPNPSLQEANPPTYLPSALDVCEEELKGGVCCAFAAHATSTGAGPLMT